MDPGCQERKQMKISELDRRRARKGIDRCLDQLRQCGYVVTILDDFELFVFVSIFRDEPAGESTGDAWEPVSYVEKMLIDPLEYLKRAASEAGIDFQKWRHENYVAETPH